MIDTFNFWLDSANYWIAWLGLTVEGLAVWAITATIATRLLMRRRRGVYLRNW